MPHRFWGKGDIGGGKTRQRGSDGMAPVDQSSARISSC
jgi:hypothetical protein